MNRELFAKILGRIKADPKTWNQAAWSKVTECGTAFCFAGHVVNDMGMGVSYDGDVFDSDGEECDHVGHASEIAAEALDIGEDEAEWLFSHERTIDDFELVLELGDVQAAADELVDESDPDDEDEDEEE